MGRPHALLRAGFPYYGVLGMRRYTSSPVDLAFGENGLLYVLCRHEGVGMQIKKISQDDQDLGPIGGTGTGDGKFTWPVGLIRDREGKLYVSDDGLHRISIFGEDGTFLRKWGEHGDGDGQLNRPAGLAFDPEENMYVVDGLNHRVQKFTKDGRFLMNFGGFGTDQGQLNMPWGITVDELGDVYVVDWRNDRVQKFTAGGEFVFTFGRSGSGEGEFNRPAGIDVDKDGDIYVADRGNDRVQQFDATGRYVDKFIGDATLGRAAKYLVSTNSVVLRLREMTTLEQSRRFRAPTAVKVNDEGFMYVADQACNRVQIYKKDADHLEAHQLIPHPGAPRTTTV